VVVYVCVHVHSSPRYKLLLTELLRHTEGTHKDHQPLEKVSRALCMTARVACYMMSRGIASAGARCYLQSGDRHQSGDERKRSSAGALVCSVCMFCVDPIHDAGPCMLPVTQAVLDIQAQFGGTIELVAPHRFFVRQARRGS